MVLFGISLKGHNPFLGYTGDFDEAAAACFKTAFVFGGLSALSLGAFVMNAVRSKMAPPPIARLNYEAV